MGLRDDLAFEMAEAIGDYGQTFEWKGGTYPCVRRDTPTELELQEFAGDIVKGTAWIVVAKLAFQQGSGPFPQPRDPIDGHSRQIKGVNGTEDPGAAQLILMTGSFDS